MLTIVAHNIAISLSALHIAHANADMAVGNDEKWCQHFNVINN